MVVTVGESEAEVYGTVTRGLESSKTQIASPEERTWDASVAPRSCSSYPRFLYLCAGGSGVRKKR